MYPWMCSDPLKFTTGTHMYECTFTTGTQMYEYTFQVYQHIIHTFARILSIPSISASPVQSSRNIGITKESKNVSRLCWKKCNSRINESYQCVCECVMIRSTLLQVSQCINGHFVRIEATFVSNNLKWWSTRYPNYRPDVLRSHALMF